MALTLDHAGWSVLLMLLQKSAGEGHRRCPQSLTHRYSNYQKEHAAEETVKHPTSVPAAAPLRPPSVGAAWMLPMNLCRSKCRIKSCCAQTLSTTIIKNTRASRDS